MKKLLRIAVMFAVSSPMTHAQALITRAVISDGKGYDFGPRVYGLQSGDYAVIWARGTDPDGLKLRGRIVTVNGTAAGGIRSSLVGPSLYRWSSYAAAPTPDGNIVIGGTKESDRQIVTRVYDSKLKPRGGIVTVGQAGYNLCLTSGPTNTIAAWLGSGGAFVTSVDSGGRFASDPVALPTGSSSTMLVPHGAVTMGDGFLVVGLETMSDYSTSRACGVSVPTSLTGIGKTVPYESAKQTNSFSVSSAFEGETGLVLFGHGVSDTTSLGYARQLKSNGKPGAKAKKYPAGGSSYTSHFRIIPLTGTGKFAATWYDPGAGLMYLQTLTSKGVATGTAVTVSDNSYSIENDVVDVVWDASSKRVIVVYAEYPPIPVTHEDIWVAVFDFSTLTRE